MANVGFDNVAPLMYPAKNDGEESVKIWTHDRQRLPATDVFYEHLLSLIHVINIKQIVFFLYYCLRLVLKIYI